MDLSGSGLVGCGGACKLYVPKMADSTSTCVLWFSQTHSYTNTDTEAPYPHLHTYRHAPGGQRCWGGAGFQQHMSAHAKLHGSWVLWQQSTNTCTSMLQNANQWECAHVLSPCTSNWGFSRSVQLANNLQDMVGTWTS